MRLIRHRITPACALLLAMPLAMLLALLPMAHAQVPEKPAGETPQGPDRLRGVEREIERSTFEQKRLGYEIENLSNEAQALRGQLVDVARRVRAAEDRMAEAESRLETITAQESALRLSLIAREKVTVEVLAAMQRIGRRAPPALLVAPEDVLSSMRAAILLGAVVPELREEALALVKDLKTLVDLRRDAAATRHRLALERDQVAAERTRLAELIENRQRQIGFNRTQLDAERQKIANLSREARSLRDLIARSENEIVGSPQAVEFARRAPPPVRGTERVASLQANAPAGTRLQPRRPFAEMRGQVPMPVSGSIIRQFGQPDAVGGTERGITIQSIRDATVVAPADGWVHFAGPYRGYGQLVILNVGAGHHIVMAGLGGLSVEIGPFVLAGEPLGNLGLSPAIQPGDHVASSRPALYVEFRKDGAPVDPAPWWLPHSAEKARG
ncbi:MAG: peptidoglycan DD-metalloendopeptidase family protein [Methylobacterium sp.]|nr:peptidoglycan DD-metalloendopeptidase family protein [Methylobacterium sp.]